MSFQMLFLNSDPWSVNIMRGYLPFNFIRTYVSKATLDCFAVWSLMPIIKVSLDQLSKKRMAPIHLSMDL